MEIGLFQLENLFLSRTQFCFLDLRSKNGDLPESLRTLLAKATIVEVSGLLPHLEKTAVPKTYPVVLVCEKGKASAKAARQLEKAGFENVYVVTGGTLGLESEL